MNSVKWAVEPSPAPKVDRLFTYRFCFFGRLLLSGDCWFLGAKIWANPSLENKSVIFREKGISVVEKNLHYTKQSSKYCLYVLSDNPLFLVQSLYTKSWSQHRIVTFAKSKFWGFANNCHLEGVFFKRIFTLMWNFPEFAIVWDELPVLLAMYLNVHSRWPGCHNILRYSEVTCRYHSVNNIIHIYSTDQLHRDTHFIHQWASWRKQYNNQTSAHQASRTYIKGTGRALGPSAHTDNPYRSLFSIIMETIKLLSVLLLYLNKMLVNQDIPLFINNSLPSRLRENYRNAISQFFFAGDFSEK